MIVITIIVIVRGRPKICISNIIYSIYVDKYNTTKSMGIKWGDMDLEKG